MARVSLVRHAFHRCGKTVRQHQRTCAPERVHVSTRSTPRVVTVEKGQRDGKQDHDTHQGWCKQHTKVKDD
jgi:hypothetical protein